MPSKVLYFFFVKNSKYINTHTHGKGGEGFQETDNGVYPKGSIS